MQVSLTPEIEEFIHKKVESGMYLSASEVVQEALGLLDERDRLDQLRLDALRKDVAIGIEQADRGELIDGPVVFDRIREKLRMKTGQGS